MSAVGVQELPARDTSDQSARRKARRLPRINFRPLLFAAVGCVTGVYLYLRIAFGGFVPSDALFVAVFCALLVLRPKRGAIAAAILFIAFAGLGAGLAHWERSRFAAGMPEGEYAVTGTVQSAAVQNGRQERVQVVLHAAEGLPRRAVGKGIGALSGGLQFTVNGWVHVITSYYKPPTIWILAISCFSWII